MNSQKVNVTELKDGDNLFDQISKLILDSMNKMIGGEFLVVDRQIKGDFFSIFSDSLFDYDAGIILLERFFKRDKCKLKGEKVKTFTDDDKKIISEFELFSNSIPKAAVLTESERQGYTDKINEYLSKIKEMTPDIRTIESYSYKRYALAEFENIDKDTLEKMSQIYAAFCINMISALTWSSLQSVSIGVTTIEYDDYIDMILTPIRMEKEEN